MPDQLTRNQFAVANGAMNIDTGQTSIQFSRNGSQVTMTLSVVFTPDQMHADDDSGPINLNEEIGQCGIFTFDQNMFDSQSPAFSISTASDVSIISAELGMITRGIKGNHSNSLLSQPAEQLSKPAGEYATEA